MTHLPTAATLATLIDETFQTMYGVPTRFTRSCSEAPPVCQAQIFTIVVPLIGDPLYIVTASAHTDGGSALASALFSCDPQDATEDMIEDSLRELCNMVAGQVKSLSGLEHELGLPSRLTDVDTVKGVQHWSGANLCFGQHPAEVSIAVAAFADLG